MPGESPQETKGFYAVRARSVKNAAEAQNFAPPRSNYQAANIQVADKPAVPSKAMNDRYRSVVP